MSEALGTGAAVALVFLAGVIVGFVRGCEWRALCQWRAWFRSWVGKGGKDNE